jgi:hypothetical protein
MRGIIEVIGETGFIDSEHFHMYSILGISTGLPMLLLRKSEVLLKLQGKRGSSGIIPRPG